MAQPERDCNDRWPSALDHSLRADVDGWCEQWQVESVSRTVRIEISVRMRSCLGRAMGSRRLVRLNAALLVPGGEILLREVLCHELAHIAVYELHGRRARPHGEEWKNLLRAADYAPRVTVHRQTIPDPVREMMRKPRRRRITASRRSFSVRAVLRRVLGLRS